MYNFTNTTFTLINEVGTISLDYSSDGLRIATGNIDKNAYILDETYSRVKKLV